MTHLTVLTAILLSSSMLAATAAAQPNSESLLCTPLGQRLGVCQTIGVTASAAGPVVDLLRKDHMIVPIEQTAEGVLPSHLVIGPADLDDPQVIALLKRSYKIGKTVAIVNANALQASRYHRLIRLAEAANCRPASGHAIISLYGLQRSRYRFPPQNSSYCLLGLDQRHPLTDRVWLFARFGLTPPQPAAGHVIAAGNSPKGFGAAAADSPTQFLTSLASATHCSSKNSVSEGNFEDDLYVYTMRNFTDTGCSSCKDVGADYYLVQDNASFQKEESNVTAFTVFTGGLSDTTNGNGFISPPYFSLEFTDPATQTSFESQYSNTSSETVSASVGYSADGPNVSAGDSVSTSQSTTYDVPATQILNQSSLAGATPSWTFTPQNLPVNTDFDVNPTWTWFIPRDAYPSGGTSGEILFSNIQEMVAGSDVVAGQFTNCSVPFPFSAWTVNPPELTSLSTMSTQASGGNFTINGQYLYPGSVTAVLIGGDAVPLSTNVDLVDDTTINVTVPAGLLRPGTYPVQVNTQFNSSERSSNTLSLTLTN